MRIGIDGYAMQDPGAAGRGIGRYARDLTRAILAAAPEDEFLLYTVDAMESRGIPRAGNARLRLIPAAARTNRFTSRALDSWIYGNPDDLDALLLLSPLQSHVEAPHAAPRVLSVFYDLIPEVLANDDFTDHTYREAYETCLEVIRDYDAILTMSEHARNDLVTRRGFDPRQVRCAGADASPHFSPATTEAERVQDGTLLKAMGLFAPGFVLKVGHEDPRTGSRALAEAFSMLPEGIRSSTRLVFASDASEAHQEEIRSHAGTAGRPGTCGDPESVHGPDRSPAVHFTGWCDDLGLRALYRNAAVMVFPSRYEGFGLPILEAMRCGCPVVAGDNSSQPEVVGNAGILVNADDPHEIARAIDSILRFPERARRLADRGYEQAARFSWSTVAAKALGAIRGEDGTAA